MNLPTAGAIEVELEGGASFGLLRRAVTHEA